jgi:hypothetical protein
MRVMLRNEPLKARAACGLLHQNSKGRDGAKGSA